MKPQSNVILILGKNYKSTFNRYTFPILGRPVCSYAFMAAKHTPNVDGIFLSTDSSGLEQIGKNEENIHIIKREQANLTLSEEIKTSLKSIDQLLGYIPENIGLLFANSPCITSELLIQGFTFLEDNPEYHSIVSVMKRGEFNPTRVFETKEDGSLSKTYTNNTLHEESYFLDHRLMIVKSQNIIAHDNDTDYIENVLGIKIKPIVHDSGIWDIDYPWQVPQVESWLLHNGFSDFRTPYKKAENLKIKKTTKVKKEAEKRINVLITTVPFGESDPTPIHELEKSKNINYVINPLNRKLKENELADMIHEYDALIAGTELISKKVLQKAKKLKLISRVGIGLDSVDLNYAKSKGIKVCYTPDAPAPAVAELTIGHMLNLFRGISFSDQNLRNGIWYRTQGKRLAGSVIGIIGCGRIGSRVLKHLQGFNPGKILVNDINPNPELYTSYHAEYATKEEIYKKADLITLHIPLTKQTENLISSKEISLMNPETVLINTSRGGIINEDDLYTALKNNNIKAAAIDVFTKEPYNGRLVELSNCFFSCHMGSMTVDCRQKMENEATNEVIRYFQNNDLLSKVPDFEYNNQEYR